MNVERTESAVPPVPVPQFTAGTETGAAGAQDPMACHIGHITPHRDKKYVTVEVWHNHVRVKRMSSVVDPRPKHRGKVNGLSSRAGRRLRWSIENTPELMAPGALFICLTYPSEWPHDGRLVKRHLDTFGKRCRRVGAAFAWALEYQTRGAPHFHLIGRFPDTWNIKQARQWVAEGWYEIVGSGDEKHLRAGTSVEEVNASALAGWYLSRYVGKKDQKTVPPGVTFPGRMWGMVGCKPPKPKIIRFEEGNRDGIDIIRGIRRSASSDFAFRQRNRYMSRAERIFEARWVGDSDPKLRKMILDFKNVVGTTEVRPENRKSWSPRDAGREKGFSVRNAARVARLLVDVRRS